jgi:hypothetical protein
VTESIWEHHLVMQFGVPINAPKSGKRMELVNHDWEPRAPSPFCIWENRSPISTSFEINRSNGDSITYPDFFVGAMETPLHDLILFCKWCSRLDSVVAKPLRQGQKTIQGVANPLTRLGIEGKRRSISSASRT